MSELIQEDLHFSVETAVMDHIASVPALANVLHHSCLHRVWTCLCCVTSPDVTGINHATVLHDVAL